MLIKKRIAFLLMSLCAWMYSAAMAEEAGGKGYPLDPQRVDEIARMLPEKPAGIGRPITDRHAWGALAKLPAYQDLLVWADQLNDSPIPVQTDEMYLMFSKTGDRMVFQSVAEPRREHFSHLVMAECLTDTGKYLPKIKEYIQTFAAEKTWVLPAHDKKLSNFEGRSVDPDLGSLRLGWHIATARWLLGDRLDQQTRDLMMKNLEHHVVDPILHRLDGTEPPLWWMDIDNNWNAVCYADSVGAVLASVEDRRVRARFVAAAEKYTKNYIDSFPSDGYCIEGIGYWNYGFGHYILLSETIRQATGGKIDLMSLPEVKPVALFGSRIQIIGNISPAFADSAVGSNPDGVIMWYLKHYFNKEPFVNGYEEFSPNGRHDIFYEMLLRFPNEITWRPLENHADAYEIRHWFDKSDIYIGRPVENSTSVLGVAIKGGNNQDSHHGHYDMGNYVVVAKDRAVILDPGNETYTRRTFSKDRYVSQMLNSYGHSVPLVAGELQRVSIFPPEKASPHSTNFADVNEERPGGYPPPIKTEAKVLVREFTDKQDTLSFDLTSCYSGVPSLKSLVRTFIYSREGTGSLKVIDEVTFSEPQTFGTAMITAGTWSKETDGGLQIHDHDRSVSVVMKTSAPVKVAGEQIKENAPIQPTRIGIDFTEKVQQGRIELTITPK